MKKRKKHVSPHLENLIDLRERNPQAYARLGERPRQSVERYEAVRLAESFEYRPGTERLIELRERLPNVYALFSSETKRMVEDYLGKKRASQFVGETSAGNELD